jgi:hypothetical protein
MAKTRARRRPEVSGYIIWRHQPFLAPLMIARQQKLA